MKIKVLGNNLIRDTKFSVFKIGKYAVKLPFSLAAWQEAKIEHINVEKAKKDLFFCSYIPCYKYFFAIKIIPYLKLFNSHANKEKLIKKYFAAAFKNFSDWEEKRLQDLIGHKYFFRFIDEYIPADHNFWVDYLNNSKIKKSSSHGDFYADNILLKGDKLFFIDWIRYRLISSRYFDLIDFYVFSKKDDDKSWMDVWQENFGLNNIFGIEVNNNYWAAYGIWKTAEELKTIYLRNGLYEHKRKKYIKFINNLAGIIRKLENK